MMPTMMRQAPDDDAPIADDDARESPTTMPARGDDDAARRAPLLSPAQPRARARIMKLSKVYSATWNQRYSSFRKFR
jgi:hypothetical protein